LPFFEVGGKSVRLTDLMSSEIHDRPSDELHSPGLYLDLPGWAYNVFELKIS
jgi:hypothetical protein